MSNITIPHPENPEHVDNMRSIELLEAQGYKGTDNCLATSLFEYGLIWREIKDEESNEAAILFIHRHTATENHFDRTVFAADLNVWREFDWLEFNALYDYLGIIESEFEKLSLPQKIYALVGYKGEENFFGTSYWEGFEVAE